MVRALARLFDDAFTPVSDPWLRRALDLAARGLGMTSPNPPVGCVLVRDGEVVGEGFHERAGLPHAEAAALDDAAEAARGATAYVTLEPCTHEGRTPPCADALVSAGVERVIIGMRDPNPAVSGHGAEALREAGVQVEFAPDPRPFQELLTGWTHFVRTGLPFVRVKVALTLDGKPALARGVCSSLSGTEARDLTMRLRSSSDAVLVSARTVAIDDPSLAVRSKDGEACALQPARIVLSRTSPPPEAARIFHDGLGRVTILVGDDASVPPALAEIAEVVPYGAGEGLFGALRALSGRGHVNVLVEAGPGLFTALWGSDLIDELVLYQAGGVGGASAPPLFVDEEAAGAGELVLRMRVVEAGVAGDDAVTVWRRKAETKI